MPISTKYAYGLTWEQVSGAFGTDYFPFSQLTGEVDIIGPFGGIVVIAGIDEVDPPHIAGDHIVQVFSSTGTNSGNGTAIVTRSADAEGDLTFNVVGQPRSFLEGGVRIACDLADEATYFIVLQTGNNIPPPDPTFNGIAPPPNKVSTPVATTPDPSDEWGFTFISWTTPDDIDTEVMGFRVNLQIPSVTAYIVGVVPVNANDHPNYTLAYAIGSNEFPSDITQYTFTVEPYLFASPDNFLGEVSDPSDPVIFSSNNPDPPVPVVPDILIPDPDETPVLGPNGTFTGVGYGGFNLGGSSLDDAVFIMNPSGIYTLEEGKLHDTLYERMTGITTQDVKIPDPFAKTGFV